MYMRIRDKIPFHRYKPYTGPAGPIKAQRDGNNLVIEKILQEFFGIETKWIPMPYCEEDGTKVIEFTIEGETFNTDYDRWGYVVDGLTGDEIDQVDISELILWLFEYLDDIAVGEEIETNICKT